MVARKKFRIPRPVRQSAKAFARLTPTEQEDLVLLCELWYCDKSTAIRRALRDALKRAKRAA